MEGISCVRLVTRLLALQESHISNQTQFSLPTKSTIVNEGYIYSHVLLTTTNSCGIRHSWLRFDSEHTSSSIPRYAQDCIHLPARALGLTVSIFSVLSVVKVGSPNKQNKGSKSYDVQEKGDTASDVQLTLLSSETSKHSRSSLTSFKAKAKCVKTVYPQASQRESVPKNKDKDSRS